MRWTSRALCLALLPSLGLAACGDGGGGSGDEEQVGIGVVTLMSHPALDQAQQGFIEGLAEAGYVEGENLTIDLQNANGDQSTLTNVAAAFASSDDDLFYAIATPSAQTLAQQIADRPIVFAAVTDPVAAELVSTWEEPDANITGVSDMNPMDGQVALIDELLPEAQRIGIVYASGEVNSEVQVEQAQAAAAKLGKEIVTATVTNSSEVAQAAEALDVDVFLIPTDNVVVSAAESMIQVGEQHGIPVIASDEATVERGAVAGLSVNYLQQGKDAAALAVQLLEGTKPSELPVKTQQQYDLFVNLTAAKTQGLDLPEAVADRAAKQY